MKKVDSQEIYESNSIMGIEISLKGKLAVVCGASQGIGRHIAIRFSQADCRLILIARNQSNLNSVLQELQGKDHHAIAADLSQPEKLEFLFQKLNSITQKLGPVSILINNAGGPKSGDLIEATGNDLEVAFRTHVLAAQKLAQWAVPQMKSAAGGRIINIISTSVKAPIAKLGVSNTIRAAMANWSKTLANELGADNILVNSILPGYTATERLGELKQATAARLGVSEEQIEKQWRSSIPLGRFAEPHELANVALFLASDLASYVNGVHLCVDGGRTPCG
jgi:3-oxoacyl-[acyl-carrier protein] reductase